MADTALEAVEEVMAAGGDSHPATFIEELNKRGYIVAPMWFFKDVNHIGELVNRSKLLS